MSGRTPSIPKTQPAAQPQADPVGELLVYIRTTFRRRGKGLSRRQLQIELAYPSRAALHTDLNALQEAGFIWVLPRRRHGVWPREPRT